MPFPAMEDPAYTDEKTSMYEINNVSLIRGDLIVAHRTSPDYASLSCLDYMRLPARSSVLKRRSFRPCSYTRRRLPDRLNQLSCHGLAIGIHAIEQSQLILGVGVKTTVSGEP